MDIEIKNLNYEQPAEDKPWQVRIDRGHSVLANPYRMKTKSDTERQFVLAHYRRWFLQNCEGKSRVLKELYRLHTLYKTYGRLELFCWCTPKKCHGEIIKDFIEKSLMENCYE